MDSSPILSEGHATQSIRGVLVDKSQEDNFGRKVDKSGYVYEDQISSRRYQTFEELDGSSRLQNVD